MYFDFIYDVCQASLAPQLVKNPPAIQETLVLFLGWEDPLEGGMATHSSILAWRIPWTEGPCWLQSMGSLRVVHDWVTKHSTAHDVHHNFHFYVVEFISVLFLLYLDFELQLVKTIINFGINFFPVISDLKSTNLTTVTTHIDSLTHKDVIINHLIAKSLYICFFSYF